MPYFKDVDTLEIVTRQHQINAESIDGLIEPIGDDLCYIVAHVPNKKMGWDLKPIDKLTPDEALEKVESLGSQAPQKGQPFYRAVLVEDLKEYASLTEDYYLESQTIEVREVKPRASKVIQNEEVSEPKDRSSGSSEKNKTKYKPKLYRDVLGENPIGRRSRS